MIAQTGRKQAVGSIPTSYHSLILASTADRSVKNAIYKRIQDYLSNGYAVIYAAEPDPSKVIQRLSKIATLDWEIENHIANKALIIVDRDEFYSPRMTQLDARRLTNSWLSLISQTKRQYRSKGIVAIGTLSAFLRAGNAQKLFEYEHAIDKQFSWPIETVCLYDNARLTAKLSFSQLVSILNFHNATIHNGWFYRQWRFDDIIAFVREGVDNVFGNETSSLIFKTLKLVYRLTEETIALQPGLFEEKVSRIIGGPAAELAFEIIADAIRKEASFNRIARTY